jgi:hypothetical protein
MAGGCEHKSPRRDSISAALIRLIGRVATKNRAKKAKKLVS